MKSQNHFPSLLVTYKEALELAFQRISKNEVISNWMDSWEIRGTNPNIENYIQVPDEGCLKDERRALIKDSKATGLAHWWKYWLLCFELGLAFARFI